MLSFPFQSTHPRGVRLPNRQNVFGKKCFNPRTHEGCDKNVRFVRKLTNCFNPRTHEGCDSPNFLAIEIQTVSIHAPTRGATSRGIRANDDGCFNPRTHEGCDLVNIKKRVADMFQSTHPRGVRHAKAEVFCAFCKFQSTHPRGVRPWRKVFGLLNMQFQSTHPRGVRL